MSDADSTPAQVLDYDIGRVLQALPHRYPLLLVDRVRSIALGERIHAIKAVSMNEQFFQGHFPGAPIMPGVLQIEALAQAAGILGIETMELAGTGKLVIDLHVEFTQKRSRVYKFKGVASVEGKTTCEVEFTAMMVDKV